MKPLDDGGARIQAIEINGNNKQNLLIVSVYLPAIGGKDHISEFQETVDQLYELHQKYIETHQIIIGGDLNEDLGNISRKNRRKQYLAKLIEECELCYHNSSKTFVKANGEECSELDYFLYSCSPSDKTIKQMLSSVAGNLSDHYPIKMTVLFPLRHKQHSDKNDKKRINRIQN